MEEAIEGRLDVYVLGGKGLYEYTDSRTSKAGVIKAFMKTLVGPVPVHFGDDFSGNSAFEAVEKHGVIIDGKPICVFGVKIGLGPTEAKYRLPDVEACLETLKLIGAQVLISASSILFLHLFCGSISDRALLKCLSEINYLNCI